MAARKLQQEIDKEFKRVAEGVAAFDGIYDKLSQSTNSSQKEKLEDSLKKEIKKLQRSRDKIKGWASQNDIKDKKPLLEQRKLIESRMEMFKAVEKEMKTKAYSKEGLSAAAKLDPKEREKMEVCQFLTDTVDELSRQIESHEAEVETMQAGLKKGKKDSGKAERISELERTVERHKWHTGKLEILLRSLENGSVDVEQVKEIEDGIKYYVEQNQEMDFMEDDSIYDDLNLDEEEDMYGISNDNDKVSSQDTQSIQDDTPDLDNSRTGSVGGTKTKSTSISDAAAAGRRSSVQMKSPLPALSTLHSSLPGSVSSKVADIMKPAPLPTIPTGQTLKYASAAAAAAASDKNGVGIAPLPPPPGGIKSSETASPAMQPATVTESPLLQNVKAVEQQRKQPTPVPKEDTKVPESAETIASSSKVASVKPSPQVSKAQPSTKAESRSSKATSYPSPDSGIAGIALPNGDVVQEDPEEESIFHLPSSLSDLLESFEETKQRVSSDQPFDMNMLNASRLTCPTPLDAEKPDHYKPQNPYAYTPAHYPQEPIGIFDDPRLYSRIDTDSLFYAFYYRQGTYQQFLAAKALKSQSWRFHKQYQTWFQRHEEPKNITEEFEQGTYRFFDYESTWMNRRKADFKFAYKFLEDDL
ncbi:general negative regulator of transcription subunit 3 [Acrodontium crateriforme]|uniref:General negative regulator of transcription subunit n=1 Tax=Acrodontium crateriforme TaxID=150365 RepID=A0AAQ3RAT8_9PEZI|nr:general negative regulator of transcription subunit 3 [Acrodontium crateriforme]